MDGHHAAAVDGGAPAAERDLGPASLPHAAQREDGDSDRRQFRSASVLD